MSVILLVDNGSTRAQATLALRDIATQLSERTGQTIHPVSLQHADQIPAAQLGGQPAQVLHAFLAQQLRQGERTFIVLPLFFGISKAITSFIPAQTALLTQQFGRFELHVAPVIYPLPEGEPLLTQIIHEHSTAGGTQFQAARQALILVDHGSPSPAVTAVRQHIAATLQRRLPAHCQLSQAVMERRTAKEYDFNGVLLSDHLASLAQSGYQNIIVALLFFLPGRHAGSGGDIETICAAAKQTYPQLNIAVTPLISAHPNLVSILATRLRTVAESPGSVG